MKFIARTPKNDKCPLIDDKGGDSTDKRQGRENEGQRDNAVLFGDGRFGQPGIEEALLELKADDERGYEQNDIDDSPDAELAAPASLV